MLKFNKFLPIIHMKTRIIQVYPLRFGAKDFWVKRREPQANIMGKD